MFLGDGGEGTWMAVVGKKMTFLGAKTTLLEERCSLLLAAVRALGFRR